MDAIKAVLGDQTEVVYEQVPSPDTLARGGYDYAVVAVGEPPYAEFTGDNSELTIPFNGADIISSVAVKIPTLVVMISGRPLVIEPHLLCAFAQFQIRALPLSGAEQIDFHVCIAGGGNVGVECHSIIDLMICAIVHDDVDAA